jgi:ATP-dependent protease HslVU (ClpYQ) peptidase subunit
MTTIAYHHKDKQVAVDSRATGGTRINTNKANKTRKNDNGLWFLTGAVCDIDKFITMVKDEKCGDDIIVEVSGFRISDGRVYWCFMADGFFCEEYIDYSMAIGSGGDFALAAMDFGKSAKEAINYAKTRDSATGGRVRVFDVK